MTEKEIKKIKKKLKKLTKTIDKRKKKWYNRGIRKLEITKLKK